MKLAVKTGAAGTAAARFAAPAKLNLFLHVVGRRADGYHLLQTALRFIDYATMGFSGARRRGAQSYRACGCARRR